MATTKKRFSEQNEDKYSFGWDLPVKWEEGDISGEYSLPEVNIYPNNRFGDIARSQGLETARNWRKVREGTTAGINRFASPVTEGAVTAVSFSPAGGIVDAADIYNDLSRGNYAGAGTTAALAFLPWGKMVRKGGSALRRQALRLPGYEALERKAVETAEKYGRKTWDKLQPYLYLDERETEKLDNARKKIEETKIKKDEAKDVKDKAWDEVYNAKKKEEEALSEMYRTRTWEENVRGKLDMTDTWGFQNSGNPYRYKFQQQKIDDIENLSLPELYDKYGITIFDPNDRRFIGQLVNNGWDIRKVDYSKLSNKELGSFSKISEQGSKTKSFRDLRKRGMLDLRDLDDDGLDYIKPEIRFNIRSNASKFNGISLPGKNIELGTVDLEKIGSNDFLKVYESRLDKKNRPYKIESGNDGKIRFSAQSNTSKNENIYSGLNTGENSIWDIKGGKMHRFNISTPHTENSISLTGDINPEDFSHVINRDNNKFLNLLNRNKNKGEYFTPIVDKDYVRILKQNIEEVKRRLPGFKEFGSSVSASSMGLPHATDDIDGFMTLEDLEKVMGKDALKSMPVKRYAYDGSGRILTYKYNMDIGAPEKLPIDINVVDEPENFIELIRQIRPGDYYNQMQEAARNIKSGTRSFTPFGKYNPKEILGDMDPESKTIADMFEIDFAGGENGSKMKHKMRPIVMIANGDPEKVAKGMDTWAKGNFGPDIKQAPDMRGQFTDIERNKKMLQQMGYEYSGTEADIAKDPQKMQNAFNYWYLSTTVRGRGVNPTGETPVYTMMTDWNPASIGGNINGAGLNTVTMGDSGYGQIYGYIQPDLNSSSFKTPEEVIASTNRAMGMPSHKLTKEEADTINKIMSENIKSGEYTKVMEGDSPENILNNIPMTGYESDKVLDELDRQLGFRSLTRNSEYRNELYSSMTGEMKPGEVVAVNYPRTASLYARKSSSGENVLSDDYAIENIIDNLNNDLNNMGAKRNDEFVNVPLRYKHKYDYVDFEAGKSNGNNGKFIEGAINRKKRFAKDEYDKSKENYLEKNYKANTAHDLYDKAYHNYINALENERLMDNRYSELLNKRDQGTKYIDYGIRSGFGLYGLSNLYDYMADKAKQDREKDKEKSNGRRFGNEK